MVEGINGGGEGESITAASAAYLNKPVELTAKTLAHFARRSPAALGPCQRQDLTHLQV
jgi:hypothetical protein